MSKKQKNRIAEVANTVEWLITAFVLAFVFRVFVMEAYRIPTGSMADTLKGAHFRLCCSQCGYKYNHNFVPGNYRYNNDTVPRANVLPPRTRCPSCGYFPSNNEKMLVANGDRILVLKCLYQFFEPKQWDVVVFKSPLEPKINFIKRLIGRPGETIEIIDGDIYVDGSISRKPPKVQNELWMPIYDNDYQPARPVEGSFNGHAWRQPFNVGNSKWTVDENNAAAFRLDTDTDKLYQLRYDSSVGNDFKAAYAYNEVQNYRLRPNCSDLKIRFYAHADDATPSIGASLSKYQSNYRAWINNAGEMIIAKISGNKETILKSKTIETEDILTPTLIEFANVDHQLIFKVGQETLTYDLGSDPNAAGPRQTKIEPKAAILGAGKLTISHVAIFRDIHYTQVNGHGSGNATQGNPLKLEKDQFFVLGDNSPNSADSRWWNSKGIGNNNRFYREGIVPREYLVGKALLVYWPSGFKPFAKFPFSIIPNVGQMKLIHNGSSQSL